MHVELPGQSERERILARYIKPFELPAAALKSLGEAMEPASPALIRQFCEGLKRNLVVGPKAGWNMQKEAVVSRVVAAIAPHPDLEKPRLWAQGAKDISIRCLPWPMAKGEEEKAA